MCIECKQESVGQYNAWSLRCANATGWRNKKLGEDSTSKALSNKTTDCLVVTEAVARLSTS